MLTRTKNIRSPQTKAVANAAAASKRAGNSAVQLADNSRESLQLRRLQFMADNSPQAKKAAQLQAMADESSNYSVDDVTTNPEKEEAADSQVRKCEAREYLEKSFAAGIQSAAEAAAILEETKSRFNLSALVVDTTEDGTLRIGFGASLIEWVKYGARKLVGNNASDWIIWGTMAGANYASSLLRRAPTTTTDSNIWWGPLTGRSFGSYMMADPLTKYGPSGSQPSAEGNTTWDTLKKRKQKANGSSTYYVRGHLLNDNIHGPGDDWKNLTPLSQRTNNHSPIGHLRKVEKDVKKLVIKQPVAYQVTVKYGRSPLTWPRYVANAINYWSEIGDVLAAEDHVPTGLWCKVWVYDAKGKATLDRNEFIPQMQLTKTDDADHYYVKLDNGTVLDITDQEGIAQTLLELSLLALIGTAMGISGVYVSSVIASYCGSMGITAAQFLMAHQYKIGLMAGALSAYMSSGKNQWPRQKSLMGE